METQLVIFLAFTSVAVLINALLLLLVYKSFQNVSTRVTLSMREFQASGATREWLDSLLAASQSARELTEVAKERLEEFDPVLTRTQDKYGFLLAKIDKKLEDVSEGLTRNAVRVRDSVARPAFSIGSFVAGLATVLGALRDEEDEI